MLKFFYLITLSLLIILQVHPQTPDKFHTYSGASVLSAEVRITRSYTDFKKETFGFTGIGSYEYFLPSTTSSAFGLRVFGGAGTISGKGGVGSSNLIQEFNSNIFFLGGGLVYSLSLSKTILPYIFAGASILHFNPEDVDGNALPRNTSNAYTKNEINFNSEIGIRFFVSKNLSLNLSGASHLNGGDNLDDFSKGSANDIFFTFGGGISYILSAQTDNDGDGIEDGHDVCMNTPEGIRVDDFGCPLDSDNDNIADYLDKCPDSPWGVKVDAKGCPSDLDKDGVADYKDNCPETPSSLKVDEHGCLIDSDEDGIPDYLDKCPDTKPGIKIDVFGCEVETDKKPVQPVKKLKKIILKGVADADSDNVVLTPKALESLSKLIPVMQQFPETSWKIIGHTSENNKQLSLEKAKSVLEYFVSQGISPSRFEINGKGSSEPLGNNKTKAGRELNRRVEIINLDMPDSEEPIDESQTSKIYDYSTEKYIGDKIYSDGTLFTIQHSIWKSQSEAQDNATSLSTAGHDAIVRTQGNSYSVRIGYFNSQMEAKEYIGKYFPAKEN